MICALNCKRASIKQMFEAKLLQNLISMSADLSYLNQGIKSVYYKQKNIKGM